MYVAEMEVALAVSRRGEGSGAATGTAFLATTSFGYKRREGWARVFGVKPDVVQYCLL